MNKEVKPLYRKVNTRARNVWHHKGSEARYDRNTKTGLKKNMKQGKQRGLDYTPLYMFLLSNVGKNWDKVYSEAVSRLKGADVDSIYHIVLTEGDKWQSTIRCGESSLYSTLYIDDDNLLQMVDPNYTNEKIYPSCSCCTHTFNGKVLVNKFCPHEQFYKDLAKQRVTE